LPEQRPQEGGEVLRLSHVLKLSAETQTSRAESLPQAGDELVGFVHLIWPTLII
jgi:hypothetical protein